MMHFAPFFGISVPSAKPGDYPYNTPAWVMVGLLVSTLLMIGTLIWKTHDEKMRRAKLETPVENQDYPDTTPPWVIAVVFVVMLLVIGTLIWINAQ